jgi:hypothetical protein
MRSSTTRSGAGSARARSRAARPSAAVSTTNPACSRYRRTEATVLASSSTTRMRARATAQDATKVVKK